MVKDLDWNSAYGGNEDYKATMSSEVFRNFAQITLAEERREATQKPKINMEQVLADFDASSLLMKQAAANAPNPIMRNVPYDGRSFQDHVAEQTNQEVEVTEDERVNEAIKTAVAGVKQECLELEAETEILLQKRASLEAIEQELGLNSNMYYVVSKPRSK